MSFSTDTKNEIARQLPESECCRRAELICALLMTGGISFRGRGRFALSMTLSSASVIRHYYIILRDGYSFDGQIMTLRTSAFGGRTQYRIAVDEEESYKLLEALGLLDSSTLFGVTTFPNASHAEKECCKRAFLRSAFLCGGNILAPEKQYHLEFACPSEEFASFVKNLLIFFDFNANITRRKSKYVVYVKQKDVISDILRLLGASGATLQYEKILISKELSNYVNRQTNCDNRNIELVLAAAEKQLRDIDYIESEIGLDKLPATLLEYALARRANPSLSISSLGDQMEPRVSKSGIAARARRLTCIADKLRSGEDTEL